MKWILFFSIMFTWNAHSDTEDVLTRFSFGSCNKQNNNQDHWDQIASHHPELWIWLGDIVYANTEDPLVLRAEYMKLYNNPHYANFRNAVPVIGTWDDHDFGMNNSGSDNKNKHEAQKVLLDFMGVSERSERRNQEGIYHSYSYGSGDKKVKFIVLDLRFFRELPANKNAQLLGEKQWQWFNNEIAEDIPLIFIVSSTTFFAPGMFMGEEWSDYKSEKDKVLEMIDEKAKAKVIFLTGDKHFARVYEKNYVELMSSGLNRTKYSKSKALLIKLYYGRKNTFVGNNYGIVDIDWENKTVNSFLYSVDSGEPAIEHSISF